MCDGAPQGLHGAPATAGGRYHTTRHPVPMLGTYAIGSHFNTSGVKLLQVRVRGHSASAGLVLSHDLRHILKQLASPDPDRYLAPPQQHPEGHNTSRPAEEPLLVCGKWVSNRDSRFPLSSIRQIPDLITTS